MSLLSTGREARDALACRARLLPGAVLKLLMEGLSKTSSRRIVEVLSFCSPVPAKLGKGENVAAVGASCSESGTPLLHPEVVLFLFSHAANEINCHSKAPNEKI